MSRTRWFSWDGTLGQTANQGMRVSSSISNESVCRTRVPGVACWAMAWSRARWSRSLGSFLHRPSELLGALGAASTWPEMAKRGVGTIPLGETEGVHVLAVSRPQQGVVLAQMNVEHKGSAHHVCPHIASSDGFARRSGKFRCDV
jgi:hypothetical protein